MELTRRQKRVFRKWWKGLHPDERYRIYMCIKAQVSGEDVGFEVPLKIKEKKQLTLPVKVAKGTR